jgi:hypothetical protein
MGSQYLLAFSNADYPLTENYYKIQTREPRTKPV